MCGRVCCDVSPGNRAQQTIARQIAPHRIAGDAARGAASGQQVGQGGTVWTQHLAMVIDVETALRVKQGACDANGVKRRRQRAFEMTTGGCICSGLHLLQGMRERPYLAADVMRQSCDVSKAVHSTGSLRVTKIGKVLGKGEQGVIKDIPCLAAGLCQYMHGGFGVALGFIMEALS